MSELVRREKKKELARWSRDPLLINKALLQQKAGLSKTEKSWVNWPITVGIVLTLWVMLLSPFVFGNYTMQSITVPLFGFSSLLEILLVSYIVLISVSNRWDPLIGQSSGPLHWKGRRRLCLYERNRLKTQHAEDRGKRYAETDRRYKHYSVWTEPRFNPSGVVIKIIQHNPPTWPARKWGAQLAQRNGQFAAWEFTQADMHKAMDTTDDAQFIPSDLAVADGPAHMFSEFVAMKFQQVEAVAYDMEYRGYKGQVDNLEAEKLALQLRRL